MSFRLQQATVGEYYRYLYPYETLVAWLTSKGIDFVQGKNEKSAFFCVVRAPSTHLL